MQTTRRSRGSIVPVSGLKKVRAKGRDYFYHRATMTRIKSPFGSPAFLEEFARIEKRWLAKSSTPASGTLGAIIESYQRSPDWQSLSEKTREGYQRVFDVLEPMRCRAAVDLTRGVILRLRDEVIFPRHGRWLANYVPTVLSIVFKRAIDREELGKGFEDPLEQRVKHIRRPKREIQANRPWSRDECRAILDAAPIQLAIPLGLCMFAGLRKSDMLTMSQNDIRDGVISIRTKKRDTPIKVPVHPTLQGLLDRRPKWPCTQIAATSNGTPWTSMGFAASWRTLRIRMEQSKAVELGLTIHGLRHTMATRLKEAGCDEGTIADILGQSTVVMARSYSKNAELPTAVQGVVIELDQAGRRNSG